MIQRKALAVGVGIVEAFEIDRINIRQADFMAMRIALSQLIMKPQHVLVDGFHIPHGLSNSLVLAPVMRFNLEVAHAMYADLGQIIKPGLQGSTIDQATQLVDYLATLAGELGLPTRLSQVGIAEKDIDQLAIDAMLQTRLLMNSPREIKLQDAAALYREAL